jgi:hypothetical protein
MGVPPGVRRALSARCGLSAPGAGRRCLLSNGMATRAEQARYLRERSGPKRPKSPPRPKRNIGVDTSLPGVSATDRKAGKGATAERNRLGEARARSSAYALENARERPSRKSTRKGANRSKPDSNLERRRERRLSSPERRAEKASPVRR